MKSLKTLLAVLVIFITNSIFAQDCDGRYNTQIFNTVDVTTVQFGSNINDAGQQVDLMMDIYQGTGDVATNRPVVLLAFGGSFVGGARNSGELVYIATELAKKGYVAASIDYRVTSSAFNLVNEQNMVKVVFGAVQDGKAAVRFFREDAATDNEYNINPDQIFMGGTSAGGILAINLAYVSSLDLLPANWQNWATEIGGLEGESGNPGYCSWVNGVFAFAGAVGDTSYIDETDVPFYGSHATGDQTVLFNTGAPLNGLAPVDLSGTGDITVRMNNLGIYNNIDVYSGGDHPPLSGSQAILEETEDSLSAFLFNILDCNTNNLKNDDQKDCSSFQMPTAIIDVLPQSSLSLYPNPTDGLLQFKLQEQIAEKGIVLNSMGQEVLRLNNEQLHNGILNVEDLNSGIYMLQLYTSNGTVAKSFILK